MRTLLYATCLVLGAVALPQIAVGQAAAPAPALPVAIVTEGPQTATFNGTNGISLPGVQSLNLTDVSTIEFWVRPTWQRISYDPVIVSAFTDTAVRYAVVMKANKKAIGLFSNGDWDFIEFDFDDGRAHHVAFVNLGELTDVYVDGELVDSISQPIADLPIRTFHIGTVDGFDNQFVGTIGELRLWDSALEGDSIAAFMRVHILSREGMAHPDIINLVGVSDFANRRRNFTLVNNTSTMEELMTDLAMARGEIPPIPFRNEPVTLPDGTVLPPFTPEELALLAQLTAAAAAPAPDAAVPGEQAQQGRTP